MSTDALFESATMALLGDPSVTQARMFGSPGLKLNGRLFAMLVKGRLVVKLPAARVEALIASGQGERFDPGHGRLMKEWVALQPGDEREWLAFAEQAKAFAASGR